MILALVGAVLGLVVGSALTTVVDRVPDRLSLVRPGPRCPHCDAPVAGRDLIPVWSYLRLGGRCRACRTRLTVAYPIVEVLTAALFVAFALRIGAQPALAVYWFFAAVLVAVSVIDLFLFVIPDRITFPALGVSLAAMAAISVAEGQPVWVAWALCGMAAYGLVLFVPWVVKPEALGFGDVKLALLLGLHLGWPFAYVDGVRLVLMALLIGCALGLVTGLGLVVARRLTRTAVLVDPLGDAVEDGEPAATGVLATAFPFGPALCAGAVVALLASPALL